MVIRRSAPFRYKYCDGDPNTLHVFQQKVIMPGASGQNRFLLVYGSQTGQAQAIAEEAQEKTEQYGLHADLQCFSMTEKRVGRCHYLHVLQYF